MFRIAGGRLVGLRMFSVCSIPSGPTDILIRLGYSWQLTLTEGGMNYLYTMCQYPVKDKSTALLSVLGVGFALASIAVTIRVAGRIMGSTLGLDDVAIVLSMVSLLASRFR